MKKIILTLVFVFAMGIFVKLDAKIIEEQPKDCATGAYELQDYLENEGESKVEANEVASAAYDLCVSGWLVFM